MSQKCEINFSFKHFKTNDENNPSLSDSIENGSELPTKSEPFYYLSYYRTRTRKYILFVDFFGCSV